MNKLEYQIITLPPEIMHQLQCLLNTGSALAVHAQRYSRSHVVRYEISTLWHTQLALIEPWLIEKTVGLNKLTQ